MAHRKGRTGKAQLPTVTRKVSDLGEPLAILFSFDFILNFHGVEFLIVGPQNFGFKQGETNESPNPLISEVGVG